MLCRPATDDDVTAIRDLRRAWTEEDEGRPIDDPGWDDAFATWWQLERGHRRHWVAVRADEVVGMVSIVTMRRMPRPGLPTAPWGYLHHLYVLAAHRDAGVGAALLTVASDACRADGFQQLVLNPRPRSLPFYRRLGFRPADHLLVLPLGP